MDDVTIPADLNATFAASVRELRGPMSRAELSRRSGVSQDSLRMIEHGEGGSTLSTVAKVAAALGVPPDQMLGAGRSGPLADALAQVDKSLAAVPREDGAWRQREVVASLHALADEVRRYLAGAGHTDMNGRPELTWHLVRVHGGYPPGHDFTLRSTTDVKREHQRRHQREGAHSGRAGG